ncbi:hypothetical protein ACQW5G_05445 [Fructilactobacillus sp. Tb1]
METSRLMQKFGYQIDWPNEGEFNWGEDFGREIIEPDDTTSDERCRKQQD